MTSTSTPDDFSPAAAAERRLRVELHGAVQGVGFRPYVYRLATGLGLAGWVLNDAAGVFIEVQGPAARLEEFLQRLPLERPARSLIQSLDAVWLAPAAYSGFEIRHSETAGPKTVLALPDIALCPDCLAEVFDPANRRAGYAFTNCTLCGPRFSILRGLPYDRPNTTMAGFTMCAACQAEYDDPQNRRFHAQPNACAVCGPQVSLGGAGAEAVAGSPVEAAAAALRAGQIVAVKGLGGFHLVVDAGNAQAVQRLRQRKQREEKPLAVMVRNLEAAAALVQVDEAAAALLSAPEAPIVLLPRRAGAAVAREVAPGTPTLGVMLAYTPLHHLLLAAAALPAVVATSGNLSDEPICTVNAEALVRLGAVADLFLGHDRPIERPVDDSVAWIVDGEARCLRRSRGYAPLPVLLRRPAPVILAVGAHLKNTVALSIGRQVFVSQHIGDLHTAEARAAFERTVADFLRLYEVRPERLAYDLHPDYASTLWATEQLQRQPALMGVGVQHHHAHLAACLAENQVDGPALGVIWDGAGYGLDGAIWGGEFLLGDAGGFERVAHLRPFRLPGGDAAAREPRRIALALLWELYGPASLEMRDLTPIRMLADSERLVLGQMLQRGLSAPLTTSAGRLFDGVAALLDLCQHNRFEGQAAMAVEYAADPAETSAYPLPFLASSRVLDWQPLVEALLADLRGGVSKAVIAARLHNGLAAAIVAVAQATGEPRVALSGGCFQNRLLLQRSIDGLRAAGFEVLLHRSVPPNDGGISLGQVAVAAAQAQ